MKDRGGSERGREDAIEIQREGGRGEGGYGACKHPRISNSDKKNCIPKIKIKLIKLKNFFYRKNAIAVKMVSFIFKSCN